MSRLFLLYSCVRLAVVLLMWFPAYCSGEAACPAYDAGALLAAMKESYARVENYRTSVEVEEFTDKGGPYETKRFLYTFKKPEHIRLDFDSPHRGMVLIYPDDHGEVAVFPPGLFGFLTLHLSPNSPRLQVSAGQRIDQTDMGLLIRNISHSLTDQLRGEEGIKEESGHVLVSAVAENHFVKDKITLYRFLIDKEVCLPIRIEELSPSGTPQRTIIFHHLTVNTDIHDDIFKPGGNKE